MLLLELSLAHIVDGMVEGPSGDLWMVTWTDVVPGPDREGRFEGCARFNGGTSKITVAGITCPPFFTLAAWVRGGPLLAFHYATIMGFGEDRPFFGLHRRRPTLLNGVSTEFACPPSWTHVAVTQDDTGSRIYVNGSLIASSNSLAATGGKGLGIGCDMGRGYAWFEGEMADVRVFDEVLDERAIQEIMQPGPRESAHPVTKTDPWLVTPEPTIEGDSMLSVELEQITSEVYDIVSTEPPSMHLPWAPHVPHLEALHAAFPSAALGELAVMLGVGLAPPSSPACRLETWSHHEGGTLSVDLEPFLVEAGDVPLVELVGEHEGPAALWLHLEPRDSGAASLVTARMRGRIKLLAGAVSEIIDGALLRDGGLTLTLGGGSFGEGARVMLELVSARRCTLSLSASFDYSGGLGLYALNARVGAEMVVRVDGRSSHQQVEFWLDIAGEEIRVSFTPERLIVSIDDLREAFEEAAKTHLEGKLAELLHGRDAHPIRLLRLGQVVKPITPSFLRKLHR